MAKGPLLSVITINKNNLLGLTRTLKSVTGQTWRSFEYIVIDGASTDGSKEYLEENTSKISQWLSEPDTGIYDAMNKGVIKSTGEYLLFLNSGDEFITSDVLEKHNSQLKEKDIIYFNIKVIDGKKFWIKKCPRILTFSYLCEDTLPHQSMFIKRSLFKIAGFYDDTMKIVADWKFLILALGKYNASFKHVNQVLANYYFDGISSRGESWPLIQKERKQVLHSEFKFFLNDYENYTVLKRKFSELRRAKKIRLLIWLRLLNEF